MQMSRVETIGYLASNFLYIFFFDVLENILLLSGSELIPLEFVEHYFGVSSAWGIGCFLCPKFPQVRVYWALFCVFSGFRTPQ